jgi:hypothetical protein
MKLNIIALTFYLGGYMHRLLSFLYSILCLLLIFIFCSLPCGGKGLVSVVNNSNYTVTVYLDNSFYMTVVSKDNAPVEMNSGTHTLKATAFINSDTLTFGPRTVDVTECMMDTWTLNIQ